MLHGVFLPRCVREDDAKLVVRPTRLPIRRVPADLFLLLDKHLPKNTVQITDLGVGVLDDFLSAFSISRFVILESPVALQR